MYGSAISIIRLFPNDFAEWADKRGQWPHWMIHSCSRCLIICCVRKMANMSNEERKKRSKNFTVEEELVLTFLVDERKSILENRKSDAGTWRRKMQAWKELADSYFAKTGVRREWKALREKFINMRRRSRAKQTAKKAINYFSSVHPSPRIDVSIIRDSITGQNNTFDSDASDDMSFIGKDDMLADATDEHDATNLIAPEEDMATTSSEWPTGNPSTHCLPKPGNHNLEEETLTLIRLQQEFYRCKNQRAQEKHDQEMLREKAKLDQEVQEGKLRIEMIELEILEKRAKLDLKCKEEVL